MVPYIGTTLSELVFIMESQSTIVEGDLINFTKMRKVTTPKPRPYQLMDKLLCLLTVHQTSAVYDSAPEGPLPVLVHP